MRLCPVVLLLCHGILCDPIAAKPSPVAVDYLIQKKDCQLLRLDSLLDVQHLRRSNLLLGETAPGSLLGYLRQTQYAALAVS